MLPVALQMDSLVTYSGTYRAPALRSVAGAAMLSQQSLQRDT